MTQRYYHPGGWVRTGSDPQCLTSIVNSARISPTAYYTGEVWVRTGFSPPSFSRPMGRLLHGLLSIPQGVAAGLLGSVRLDDMLVQRHRIMDAQVIHAIESGQVGQVIELAAGLSARGLRMRRRFPHLRYIEVDLPGMVREKRKVLRELSGEDQRHIVVAGDILKDRGASSLSDIVASHMVSGVGTVVITEGLINYFPRNVIEQLWARLVEQSRVLGPLYYISDLHVRSDIEAEPAARGFVVLLRQFVRGVVSLEFGYPCEALSSLVDAGFTYAEITTPDDWRSKEVLPPSGRQSVVRIVYAAVSNRS